MISTKYFYRGSGAAGPASNPLDDILNALAGGLTGTAGEMKGTLAQLNNISTSPLLSVNNSFQKVRDTSSTTKPRAYLNWLALAIAILSFRYRLSHQYAHPILHNKYKK